MQWQKNGQDKDKATENQEGVKEFEKEREVASPDITTILSEKGSQHNQICPTTTTTSHNDFYFWTFSPIAFLRGVKITVKVLPGPPPKFFVWTEPSKVAFGPSKICVFTFSWRQKTKGGTNQAVNPHSRTNIRAFTPHCPQLKILSIKKIYFLFFDNSIGKEGQSKLCWKHKKKNQLIKLTKLLAGKKNL